ncbi:MAG: hypothetical protein R3190_13345 [Thermoanaerobaculia bacterium]|nr:hypothetical protein [Thermoanaerobaculia bacterium]
MRASLALVLLLSVLPARGATALQEAGGLSLPEGFAGTWTLDKEATTAAIEAADLRSSSLKRQALEQVRTMGTMQMKVAPGLLTLLVDGREVDTDPFEIAEAGAEAVTIARRGGAGPPATLRLEAPDRLVLEGADEPPMVFARGGDATPSPPPGAGGQGADVVAYYDALKSCVAGEFPLQAPGFGSVTNTIEGRIEDRCRVRTRYDRFSLTCNYSDETVALLTSEQKYEEARNGIFRGSTDSEESRRVGEECKPD